MIQLGNIDILILMGKKFDQSIITIYKSSIQMSDQEILPCVMCDQHHEQMLMLSCMHDPCINCAAIHYCTTQTGGSVVYQCAQCHEQTQLDPSSVLQFQRVYQQLKSKKKYDYRRNMGGIKPGFAHNQPYAHTHHTEKSGNSNYLSKTKTQPENPITTVQHAYHPSQQYTPVSQPTYPNNPYNNIIARKAQQNLYICETHPEEQLSYFCFDCQMPICPECAIHGSHRDHEVQTTRKAIKIIKNNLGECQQSLGMQMNNVSSIRDNCRNKVRDMGEQHKKDKELIREHFTSLMGILQEKEKEFQRSLDQTHENNANIVRVQINQCEKITEGFNNTRKNIDMTVKKDELTILQEYSKRQKQTKSIIESTKGKPDQSQLEGIRTIDYGLFKDQMDQLSGIMQALRLTTKSIRH